MQALPPPRRRALTPSPVVPAIAAPGAPSGPVAVQAGDAVPPGQPAAPAAPPLAVPAPRHELPGGGSPGFAARPRQRVTTPDTVVFTAPCPMCGADATWSEERDDTRLRAAVDCPCG